MGAYNKNINTEWELEEGIPQVDDPFIQKYLKGRASLIAEEQRQRHDSNFRKALSPLAVRASQIVSKIRARELKQARDSDEPAHPADRAHQSTELWKILQKLPKGSLLHAHFGLMFDAGFLVELAFTTPGIHISAPAPLITPRDYEDVPFHFQYSSRSAAESENETLWTSSYKPSALVNLQTAASSFPSGREAGFRDWLKNRFTLTPGGSPGHHNGANPTRNAGSLSIINSLLSYEPILRACLRRMFSQLAADGIRYVELRNTFDFHYRRLGSDDIEEDHFEWFSAFQDELSRFKNTQEGHKFYGARIIWTSISVLSNKDMAESMVQCILAKTEFPDLICGFDVAESEDRGNPLVDIVPIMFWFRKQCVEEGVDIPFLFHAMEGHIPGDGTSQNLFDAILLGTRRIGDDGSSLNKHPLLVDLVKEKKILVEYCPVSKGSDGLADPTEFDTLQSLLSRGVSVCLSSVPRGHDPCLTSVLWQALQGPNDMEITDLAMMIENTIRWSCYEDQSTAEWAAGIQEGILGEGKKATYLREWYADFEKFWEWVALEYAEVDMDD